MQTGRVTSRGISVGYLPSPTDFGAPPKFTSWREEQEEALVLLTETSKRVSVLEMPTGSGKSLVAYMYALLTGKRVLILTETKGLEDLYLESFGVGKVPGGQLVDIRGMNNYRCPALEPGGRYAHLHASRGKAMCDVGPCKSGLPCSLRDGGCPGYDKQREARQARVVSSNYANWLSIGKAKRDDEDESLGEFDVLILDEIHGAADSVSKALTVELSLNELRSFFSSHLASPPASDDFLKWQSWLQHVRTLQTDAMEGAMDELKYARDGGTLKKELLEDVRYLRRLGNDLGMLERAGRNEASGRVGKKLSSSAGSAEWVVEHVQLGHGRSTVSFQPVWPGPYCEQYLFRNIPRIIGMSATVRPKTMEYLGLQPGQFDFWEFDSSFPIANRPVYYLPTVFMRYDMSEAENRRWVQAVDSIAKSRPTKALVQTVSYARARYYQKYSKFQNRLLENTPESTARTVEKFKASRDPLMLVSPSVATGYDFPDDTARWQAIVKIPFPDRRSKIMQRRCESDPTYMPYLAMTYLVQAIGRIVRGPLDWGETFILDSVFGYGSKGGFYERYKEYMPKWCREAIKKVSGIPRFNRNFNKEE